MTAADIVRGVSSGASGGTVTGAFIPITAPAGVVAGDQLLAHVTTREAYTALRIPAGWTLIARPTETAGEGLFLRAKYGTDVTGTSWTVDNGAANTTPTKWAWSMVALRGDVVGDYLTGAAQARAVSGTTTPTPDITTTEPAHLIAAAGDRINVGSTWTWSAGWAEQTDLLDEAPGGTNIVSSSTAVYDTTPTAAGTYSVIPANSTTGPQGWAGIFAFKVAGPTVPANPKAATLTDTFDSFDSVKWTKTADVSIAGGQAVFTMREAYTADLASAGKYDLSESSVLVELLQAPAGTGYTDTYLAFTDFAANNALSFDIENNQIAAYLTTGGSWGPVGTAAYSPANHRWLRIRAAGSTVFWETSPTGYGSWTQLASATPSFQITDLSVGIGAGGTDTPTSTAIFDNFNSPPAPPVALPGLIDGIEPEAHGHVPVYSDGNGNLYRVTEEYGSPVEPHNTPRMMKSTNGGATWAEVDAANRPTDNDLETGWLVQAGQTLYFVWTDGSIVTFCSFNTSDHPTNPDKWVIRNERGITGLSAGSQQHASMVRLSDGRFRVFFSDTQAPGPNRQLAFITRAAAGGWSAKTRLTADADSRTGAVACVGAADKTHLFVHDYANKQVLYRTLTSGDVLSVPVRVDVTGSEDYTGTDPAARNYNAISNPVYYDAAGTEVVTALYASATGVRAVTVVGGVVQSEQVVDTAAPLISPANTDKNTGNDGPAIHLAAYDTTVYAVWTERSTGDLYWAKRPHGQPWTARTRLWDPPAGRAAFWTYNHLFRRGSALVMGYSYDDGPHTDNESNIYYNELALGIPPDVTPPSIPAGVTATADSATQVTVTWTPSTDAVGVASYRVHRNGFDLAATVTGTSYVDTTAQPDTAYTYTVSAVDAAGNRSAESAEATVHTPPPPGEPPAPTPDPIPEPPPPVEGAPRRMIVSLYRGSDYERIGQVPDYVSCSATWAWLEAGSGELAIGEDDPIAPYLLAADEEVIGVVIDLGAIRWSGRVSSVTLERNGAPGSGQITATLLDDWIWLQRMLASQGGASTSLTGMPQFDTRTGNVVSVAADYINAAASRLAVPVAASKPGVDGSAVVSLNARMTPLADLLHAPLKTTGVTMAARIWLPSDPQPPDLPTALTSPTVVFRPEVLPEKPWLQWTDTMTNISQMTFQANHPTAYRAIVGLSGQDAARVYDQRIDTGRKAGIGIFGLPEIYTEASDAALGAQSQNAGAQALAETAGTVSASFLVADADPWVFGTDYVVGDLATVAVNGVSWRERITRVTAEDSGGGFVLTPVIGDPSAATGDDMMVRALAKVAEALRTLQAGR